MATITIHKAQFAAWGEYDDEPERIFDDSTTIDVDEYREDRGEWTGEDFEVWVPMTAAEAAFHLLNGSGTDFWASECSSSGAEVRSGDNPFYMDEPYIHPYTGERTEQSAHLKGFTPEEIVEIHRLVIGR